MVEYVWQSIGGFVAILLITSTVSWIVGWLTWLTVLRAKPLTARGTLVILAVSASSAVGFRGHFYPFWAISEPFYSPPGSWPPGLFWMLFAGLPVTTFFVWWSRRKAHNDTR